MSKIYNSSSKVLGPCPANDKLLLIKIVLFLSSPIGFHLLFTNCINWSRADMQWLLAWVCFEWGHGWWFPQVSMCKVAILLLITLLHVNIWLITCRWVMSGFECLGFNIHRIVEDWCLITLCAVVLFRDVGLLPAIVRLDHLQHIILEFFLLSHWHGWVCFIISLHIPFVFLNNAELRSCHLREILIDGFIDSRSKIILYWVFTIACFSPFIRFRAFNVLTCSYFWFLRISSSWTLWIRHILTLIIRLANRPTSTMGS